MKLSIISLAVLFLPALSSAQDTTIQMQCRKLAAGEILNTDETMVNGLACRQVRLRPATETPAPSTAPASAPASKEPDATPRRPSPAPDTNKETVVAQVADNRQCLILKRMGPADQITSHMYSFGIRGKQFQYVEGDFPAGTKFHGRLTDHDVRNIQSHNGRVVIMEPKYNADDLREAKQSCKQQ